MPDTPTKRLLILCDEAYVSSESAERLGEGFQEMNIMGVILMLPMLKDGPIRLLNIDGIPPEDIESLTLKLREAVDA